VSSEGEIKLLDFGIARHLAHEGSTAERTTTGARLLSLNYAAPEQILGEPLDVQADVYALGAVLYELLTGGPPADLNGASAAELTRVIQEEAVPASAAATEHRAGAVQATRAQWQELDLLCAKALRRDKTERYESVDRLISDIDHFLNDEPLEVSTGSLRYYRVRKFLYRRRRPLAVAAAVVAAMAAVIVFFNVRLIDARDSALSSQARVQRIHRLMLNLFEGDDDAAAPAEGLRVVSLLDRGVREAESLDAEPDLQAELNYTLGGLYRKLGRLDRAEPLLVSALTATRSLFGPEDPETIRPQLGLALLRVDQSRTDEAKQLVGDALNLAKQRYAPDSLEVASCTAAMGRVLATEGRYEEALTLLEQAVGILSKAPWSVELSEALGDLANTHYYLGRVEASEAVNRQALMVDRQLFGERHPNVAVDLYNLGNIELDHADYSAGEQLFRQALAITEEWYGKDHPRTAGNLLMLGRSVAYQGQLKEAASLYRRALVAMQAMYGERHPRSASVLSLMGDLARERKELAEAERLFERAAAIFRDTSGEEHEFYLHQLSNLGAVHLDAKRYVEAETILRLAVDRLTRVVPEQRYTGLALIRLSAALAGLRRYAEAERHGRGGYDILKKVTAASSMEVQTARRVLIDIYTGLGDLSKVNEIKTELDEAASSQSR
jgi:serine/threonine-protein kinase